MSQALSEAPGKAPGEAVGGVVSEGAPVPVLASGPTIKDVALALGMHKSTVSLALSGKGNVSATTREKVLVVAREMATSRIPWRRGWRTARATRWCACARAAWTWA